ncbi:MAG: hypothetical protein V2B18_18950, partial [Pseudomonadota bacterium]
SPFLVDIEQEILSSRNASGKNGPETGRVDEKKVLAQVKTILGKTPFKFKLEQIASHLRKRNADLEVTTDQLASIIGRHGDVIGRIAVSPPIYYLK